MDSVAPTVGGDSGEPSDGDLTRATTKAWRVLLSDKLIIFCGVFLLAMGLVSIFAPVVAPHDPTAINLAVRQVPPAWVEGGSWTYPLGTDALGRDVLSATIFGSRASLFVGLMVVLIAGTFGTVMGLVAGLRGGWADQIITRAVDAQIAFPGILLIVLAAGALGPGLPVIVIVLCVFGWMLFARLVRSVVFQLKESGFVIAAVMVGCRQTRLMRKYLLPNIFAPVATLAMIQFAAAVLLEAGISYLGLGLQPPAVSWGLMIAENQAYLSTAWWSVVVPGLVLALTVLFLNMVAAAIRVKFDPQTQALARVTRAAKEERRALSASRAQPSAAPAPEEQAVALVRRARPSVRLWRRGAVAGGQAAPGTTQSGSLLSIRGLAISFVSEGGTREVVHDVDLDVAAGTSLGIVGESGSGKSLTATSVLGQLPAGGRVVRGEIFWRGRRMDEDLQAKVRGSEITLINQEPVASLDPLMTVGNQLIEVLQKHKSMSRGAARKRAKELFDLVGIPEAGRRLGQYPWEFSGGMAQRVVIAIALAPEPKLIIADEPTTAVDVTIQAQVLRVISDVQREFGLTVILITHDLGVVAGMADRLVVMYAGRVVESGPAEAIFSNPRHPYTRGLMASTPDPRQDRMRRLITIPGNPPTAGHAPGCSFHPRCELASDRCKTDRPTLQPAPDATGHGARSSNRTAQEVACWHAD